MRNELDLTLQVLIVFQIYALIGALVLLVHLQRHQNHHSPDFGPPRYQVSIIVGLRGVSDQLEEALTSLCEQRFPLEFEVIAACEDTEDPAWSIAVELARIHPHLKLVCSGKVDPNKRTGKNQNLLAAMEITSYEALVFTDSDVIHPYDWLVHLVAPLGCQVDGHEVSAATSLFYVRSLTLWSRLIAIVTNQVTFSAANLKSFGPWAPFASGASTAVLGSVLRGSKVPLAWQESFNDDLVLANLLMDHGHPIYLVRRTTWPSEALNNFSGMMAKMKRWVVTLHYYSHPSLARQGYLQSALQMQLPVALVLGIWLWSNQGLSIVVSTIILSGVIYNLLTRTAIALAIGERLGPWIILAPCAFLFFAMVYLRYITCRSFIWSGRLHRVTESYRDMVRRLALNEDQPPLNPSQ